MDPSLEVRIDNSVPMTDGMRWYASGYNYSDGPLGFQIVAVPARSVGRDVYDPNEGLRIRRRQHGRLGGVPDGQAGGDRRCVMHRPGGGPDATLGGHLFSSTPKINGKAWFASGIYDAIGTVKMRVVALCRPA